MLELVLFKAATRHTLDNNFSLSFLSPRTFNMDILLLSKEAIKTTRRLSDTNCEEIQLQPVFFVFIFVTVHSFRKHCCSQFQVLSLQEKKKKGCILPYAKSKENPIQKYWSCESGLSGLDYNIMMISYPMKQALQKPHFKWCTLPKTSV